MNEQLQQIAEETGVPADLLERAAAARAQAAGSSADVVVAGWAGEAPVAVSAEPAAPVAEPEAAPAAEPVAAEPAPAASAAASGVGQLPEGLLRRSAAAKAKREGRPLDEVLAEMGLAPEAGEAPAAVAAEPVAEPEAAPAAEPVAAEPAPAASAAASGVGQLPEGLLRRSAAAKAKREGRPLDEVLAEMGLAPEGGPSAPASTDQGEAAAPAAETAVSAAPADAEESKQEPESTAVFAGFPRWLAASFIIIPMIAVLYAALAPSGPDCGTSGQLSINPTTGEAESCGGGVSPFFTLGQSIFTERCVACHGADGGGGVGPAFTGGAVLLTFPDCPDQIDWVTIGSAAWPSPTYGATNKPVLGAGSPMPSFGSILSADEIAAVVLYERVAFGGQEISVAETTCGLVDAAG